MATKKTETINSYKGFNKDLSCLDLKYEIGETYKILKGMKLKCCPSDPKTEAGLHSCENPLDVLAYKDPASSRFAEVVASGNIDRHSDGTKIATSELHIKAEISLKRLMDLGAKFILDRVNWKDAKESNTGDRSAATNTGDSSAATNTGDRSAATNTGYRSAATNTGDRSAATNTGDRSAATNTGYRSAATNTGNRSAATNTGDSSAATNTGNRSAATNTGNRSAATNAGNSSAATNTGYRSAATNTGDSSAATNTGYSSAATVEGKESVAMSVGLEGKAKGKIGCWLVLAEWKEIKNEWHRSDVQCKIVDGKIIKEDIFYIFKNGEFKEAD